MLRVGQELVVADVVEVLVHKVIDPQRPAPRIEDADRHGVDDGAIGVRGLLEVLEVVGEERAVIERRAGAVEDEHVLAAGGRDVVGRIVGRDVVHRVRGGRAAGRRHDDRDVLARLEGEGGGDAARGGRPVNGQRRPGGRGRGGDRYGIDAVERGDVVVGHVGVERRAQDPGRHGERVEGGGGGRVRGVVPGVDRPGGRGVGAAGARRGERPRDEQRDGLRERYPRQERHSRG